LCVMFVVISAEYRSAKLHLQDLLVERSAAIARREKFDAAEVRLLFKNGAPTMRVLVLGLMQGDPSLTANHRPTCPADYSLLVGRC
jgi:hypothetical protein